MLHPGSYFQATFAVAPLIVMHPLVPFHSKIVIIASLSLILLVIVNTPSCNASGTGFIITSLSYLHDKLSDHINTTKLSVWRSLKPSLIIGYNEKLAHKASILR